MRFSHIAANINGYPNNPLLAGSAGDDACALPVVELDTESTRAIFKDGEVSFAAPDPGKIADAIEELTRNAGLVARQQEKARNFVPL